MFKGTSFRSKTLAILAMMATIAQCAQRKRKGSYKITPSEEHRHELEIKLRLQAQFRKKFPSSHDKTVVGWEELPDDLKEVIKFVFFPDVHHFMIDGWRGIPEESQMKDILRYYSPMFDPLGNKLLSMQNGFHYFNLLLEHYKSLTKVEQAKLCEQLDKERKITSNDIKNVLIRRGISCKSLDQCMKAFPEYFKEEAQYFTPREDILGYESDRESQSVPSTNDEKSGSDNAGSGTDENRPADRQEQQEHTSSSTGTNEPSDTPEDGITITHGHCAHAQIKPPLPGQTTVESDSKDSKSDPSSWESDHTNSTSTVGSNFEFHKGIGTDRGRAASSLNAAVELLEKQHRTKANLRQSSGSDQPSNACGKDSCLECLQRGKESVLILD